MSANILVIDDSPSIRQQVSNALSQAGMSVVQAADGVEGQSKIENEDFDCVICDVNMPRKNGIEMLEEVKSKQAFQGLPVVILTTEGAKELIERAKAAGACGWIVKPFKADLLVKAVKKITST